MISGIGVDLVDKERFVNLIQRFGDRFPHKILSKQEYEEYLISSNKPSFLSKRFAAKEALSKAFGFGLYRNSVYPSSITIKHDDFGKPFFEFFTQLEEFIETNDLNIHLSITDTDTQSIAFVTIDQ